MQTPEPLAIRRLVEADAPAFMAMRIAAIVENPHISAVPPPRKTPPGGGIRRPHPQQTGWGRGVRRVSRGETLVGIAAMFRPASGTMKHRGTLWGVHVVPGERGGDTAERLIGAVIEHARRHVDLLTGHVTVGNTRRGDSTSGWASTSAASNARFSRSATATTTRKS
jgi:GNAT superfamily N-acetyltransferase